MEKKVTFCFFRGCGGAGVRRYEVTFAITILSSFLRAQYYLAFFRGTRYEVRGYEVTFCFFRGCGGTGVRRYEVTFAITILSRFSPRSVLSSYLVPPYPRKPPRLEITRSVLSSHLVPRTSINTPPVYNLHRHPTEMVSCKQGAAESLHPFSNPWCISDSACQQYVKTSRRTHQAICGSCNPKT